MEEDEALATEEGVLELVAAGDARFADVVDGEGTKVGKKVSEVTGEMGPILDGALGGAQDKSSKYLTNLAK